MPESGAQVGTPDAAHSRRLQRLRRLRCRRRWFQNISAGLNSSFTVTLVGGLLLAVVSSVLQNSIAKAQRDEAKRAEDAQRKEKLAFDFANELPVTLNLIDGFKRRDVWMIANDDTSTNRYRDGRNFMETRTMYENLLDRYLAQKPVASLCNQVIGSFNSPQVPPLAESLHSNVNVMLNATNKLQVDTAFTNVNCNYKVLTRILFTELYLPDRHEK